jgi:hypothetical protein
MNVSDVATTSGTVDAAAKILADSHRGFLPAIVAGWVGPISVVGIRCSASLVGDGFDHSLCRGAVTSIAPQEKSD